MNNKQIQENTKLTTIRIPIQTYEKIERMAKENERNVSQQIRFMIEQYIKIRE